MLLPAVNMAAMAPAMNAFRRTRLGRLLRCFTTVSFLGSLVRALSYCSEMQLEIASFVPR
jgi:hypothetical protein